MAAGEWLVVLEVRLLARTVEDWVRVLSFKRERWIFAGIESKLLGSWVVELCHGWKWLRPLLLPA